MRDIKFRTWNGNEMEYNVIAGRFGAFYVNPMTKGDGLAEDDTASLTPFNTKYWDDTPLMQYTGLKDKNGKEIYEGDVVSMKCDWGDWISEIVYGVEGFASFGYKGLGENYMLTIGDISATSTTVIGNIYENPELLQ